MKPVKPGYQTSECYIAGGAVAAAVVTAINTTGTAAQIMAWAVAGGAVLAYIYTRYAAKTLGGDAENKP